MTVTQLFPRLLRCPDRSFFLFGPRGTGKSTWLRQVLAKAVHLDLLDSSLYLELSREPHRLEALAGTLPTGGWVVLDEVQKLPQLLDEAHRLMETQRWRFALCGSSARKLRRGGANLLAGRAITLSMEGLSSVEMGEKSDLQSLLTWGTLPFVQTDLAHAPDILAAYVSTYFKEEIREEGLVRNVPPFVRFLSVAALMNGQVVNGHNIAREAAVPRSTVDTYFSILVDTLVGHFLPAWQPGAKVRERTHPKFYWFDPGVARGAAGLLRDPADRAWLGLALETLVYHELRVYNSVSRKERALFYYRTPAGVEIDFIVETRKRRSGSKPHVVAVETKLAERWDTSWGKALLDLVAQPGIIVDRIFGVYMGTRSYRFGKLDVIPLPRFIRELHDGNIF